MSKAATRFCIASIKVRYSRSETGSLASRSSAKNEENTAPHPDPLPAGGAREQGSPSPRVSGEREGPVAKRREGEGQVTGASAALAAVQEGKALEQVNVLLVLQQSP